MKALRPICIPILAASLILSGCEQKTTLDQVAAILITATEAFRAEIDDLCRNGNLDARKCAELRGTALLAQARGREFAQKLARFGEIEPGDIPGITAVIGDATGLLQQILVDSGLSPDSKAVRILGYAVKALIAASGAVAIIHPAGAASNPGQPRRNPKPSEVRVTIPAPDSEVRRALEAAGKRVLKPSAYREVKDPLRVEVVFN